MLVLVGRALTVYPLCLQANAMGNSDAGATHIVVGRTTRRALAWISTGTSAVTGVAQRNCNRRLRRRGVLSGR